VVTIEGAAHAMNSSHPEQLASVVDAFLDDRPIIGAPAPKGYRTVDEARRRPDRTLRRG
jgi:hypothetical protein